MFNRSEQKMLHGFVRINFTQVEKMVCLLKLHGVVYTDDKVMENEQNKKTYVCGVVELKT